MKSTLNHDCVGYGQSFVRSYILKDQGDELVPNAVEVGGHPVWGAFG
jgi:hypothetical protein